MTTNKSNTEIMDEAADETDEDVGSIYDLFETNDGLEKKGIWLDYGKAGKFLVARAGGANQRFAKILAAKSRPLKFQIDNELLDNEEGVRLLKEAFAEAVVLDWQGVRDRQGNEIKFSQKNCLQLFEDLPALFHDIREQASKLANYRNKALEDTSKN